MKMNWGTGIAIFLGCFIIFIMYFVVRISTDEYETELVTEQFYEKGMVFQEEINAEENLKNLSGRISSKRTDQGLVIQMPLNNDYSNISGKVTLYRPSNKTLDFELPIQLNSTASIIVPHEKMTTGRWDLSVAWFQDGESYLYKEKITY